MADRAAPDRVMSRAGASHTLRRRGMLAAVAALATGTLAKTTTTPVLAGTDGDLVLNTLNMTSATTTVRGSGFDVFVINNMNGTTGRALVVTGGTAVMGTLPESISATGGDIVSPASVAGTTAGAALKATGGRGIEPNTNGGPGIIAAGGAGSGSGTHGVGIQATGGGPAGSSVSAVVGLNNSAASPAVTGQNSAAGSGVLGTSNGGIGTQGASNTIIGVYGNSSSGVGTRGDSTSNYGVVGSSGNSHGVFGDATSGSGVFGRSVSQYGVAGQATGGGNGVYGNATSGTGVYGVATTGNGVFGTSTSAAGVAGSTVGNNAVFGDASANGNGLFGRTVNGNGLVAQATGGGNAATFFGNVIVNGNFTVAPGFAKSGAVTFADGTMRRLYATEMPESWFEDVGEAQLVNGRASVPIPADFAQAVNTSLPYHVFPVGYSADIESLNVTVRAPDHFEVQANGKGVVEGTFGYRILAKRRAGTAPRFERVTGADQRAPLASDAALHLPAVAELPKLPELPEVPASARQMPPLQTPADPPRSGR